MILTFFFFSSRVSLSQPDPIINHGHVNDNEIIRDENCATVWYSQPSNIEDMFLSQMSSTPGSSQVSLLNLIIEKTLQIGLYKGTASEEIRLKNVFQQIRIFALVNNIFFKLTK